jgi:hypothetical protein
MDIVPFVSIGDLCFGESRMDIRGRLGHKHQSFKKDVGENETDAYDGLGLHLYYDRNDRLEFVEAFRPANPTFQGVPFLDHSLDEVADHLGESGYPCERDQLGLNCASAGIGLTAANGVVVGVAVFRSGYYGG